MRALRYLALTGLLALFCIPFLVPHHPWPLPSFYSEWWAGLCGLVASSVLLIGTPSGRLEIPRIALFPLGLIGLLLLQAALGQVAYPGQAAFASLYLLWAMMLMLAARHFLLIWGTERLLGGLAWALLAGGLLNALAAVLQFTKIDVPFFVTGSVNHVIYGNLAQANHLADHLALAGLSLLYLLAKARLRLFYALPLGMLLLLGLALSGSRSAWLYLLAGLVLAYLLKRRLPGRAALVTLAGAGLALGVFYLLQFLLAQQGAYTANIRLGGLASSTALRLAFLKDAWQMFTEAPWLGIGFQHHPWHHYLLRLAGTSDFAHMPGYEEVYAENAHNIALHLLAEFGILAGLLLAGAGYWLYRSLRRADSLDHWWLASILLVIAIHSLLEYPLWFAYFLGIAAVAAACLEPKPFVLSVPDRSRLRLVGLIIALGIGVLTALIVGFSALERMHKLWGDKMRADAFEQIAPLLHTAQLVPFFEPQVDSFLASLPLYDQDSDKLTTLLELNTKVMQQMANAKLLYRQATLLWALGRRTEAQAVLADACKVYPDARKKYLADLEKMEPLYPRLAGLKQQLLATVGPPAR